jgi:hypothetical protein
VRPPVGWRSQALACEHPELWNAAVCAHPLVTRCGAWKVQAAAVASVRACVWLRAPVGWGP